MKNKIRCAIIGLGRIASTLEDDKKREKPATHGGCIKAHPRTVLVAGADPDAEKRKAFAKRWQIQSLYESATEMLAKEKIDIIHIATPPENHLDIFIECLQRDIRLIILEKPIANSLEVAEKIYHLSQTSNSIIIVNHERRYARAYVYTKEIITSQKYGKLLSISAKLYMGRHRKISQVLYDDGTHILDVIRFFCNAEPVIHSISRNSKANESLIACLKANAKAGVGAGADETNILFEVAAGRDHLVFELDLHFTSGRICIGNGLFEEYRSVKSPYYEKIKSLKLEKKKFKKSGYFIEMFRDAVRCFEEPNRVPISTVEDGYRAIQLIDRLLSAKS